MIEKEFKFSKYLLMIMVVVAVFMVNVGRPKALHGNYVNYYGIEMTDDEYFTLVNLGFTDDEIYLMDEDEFLLNKDLDATLLATSRKFYKVTQTMYGVNTVTEVSELEYLQQSMGLGNQPLDIVTTTYLVETATISQNGSKYRYKDTVGWTTIPTTFSFDVIGIGFVNSVFIDSNIYFNYKYSDSNANYTTSTVYYGRTSTQYGATTVYLLPSGMTSLTTKMYFDVSKNTADTLQTITFCGDYAHAGSSVTQNQAVDHYVNGAGITFSPSSYPYYWEIPCANATAYVNW